LTVVLEWQRSGSEACLACAKCGVNESAVQQACSELKAKLAAKGIAVTFVERKPEPNMSGPSQMWVCDVPLETWLGGSIATQPCCAEGSGPDARQIFHRALEVDGQSYSVIPADLMVRAGLSAADELLAHGKIDPAAIKVPKGCAGCPSAGNCDKARQAH
jgi:hypothetical protein